MADQREYELDQEGEDSPKSGVSQYVVPQRSGDVHLPLPRSAERSDASHERPSRRNLVPSAIVVLMVVGLGVALRLAGHPARAGLVFALLALAVVVFVAEAQVAMSRYLRPWKRDVLTEEERQALARDDDSEAAERARLTLRVGTILGRDEAHQLVGGRAHLLTEDEKDAIDANRTAEAAATLDWMWPLPEPEVVVLDTDDGAKLVGHVVRSDDPGHRWAILAHDYAGHWTEMLVHARRYSQEGYSLLIPEMRAHHESGGQLVGMGLLDSQDLVAWSRWIVRHEDEGARMVMHGHGMGATAVCLAAGEMGLPSGVLAAVSDSACSDVWNAFIRTIRAIYLPAHPSVDLMRLSLRMRRGGYDIAHIDVTEAVSHARVPMLFIQGEKDQLVPPYMGKLIFDAASGSAAMSNKRLAMFPAAGHCEACLADPTRYYRLLFHFLGERC